MAKQTKKGSQDLVDKEYRLYGDIAPLSMIIKVGGKGNLLVFDEKERTNRAIRHCRNEKSIFIDEQSEHAVLDPIVVEKGVLKVRSTDVLTQRFLDIHPDNVANGGKWFYEVDEDKEAEDALKREDIILDLKSEVRTVQKSEDGLVKMQSLVAVLKNSPIEAMKMTSSELRHEIFLAIDKNPQRFVDGKGNPDLFNEKVTRRHIALIAMQSDVIRVAGDGRSIIWSKGGDKIINIPAGVKPNDHLFEFLETDDGILVLEELQNRM